MGTSQNKFKNLIKMQKPLKTLECSYCQLKFNENQLEEFQMHIAQCIRQSLDFQDDPDQIIEQLPPFLKFYHQEFNQGPDFIYQKVPINQDKTEFKWQKKSLNLTSLLKIQNFSIQTIVKRSFPQKLAWFRSNLEKFRIPWQYGSDWLKIQKDNILMTSLKSIHKINMYKQVKIQFANEKVNDAGGLLRQWMHLSIKQIFDQSTGIFQLANTAQTAYKIKWDKDLDSQFAESLFQLFGIILGKAVFQRIPLNCYLDKTILRQLTSNPIILRDVHGYDQQLYKNWKFIQNNKFEPFGQNFCLYKQHNDKTIETIQLIPDGQNIQLVEQNKHEFIEQAMMYYCVKSVANYIQAIRKAFHKIIPIQLFSIFDTYEIQMILYGIPFINIDDWIAHTQYKGIYNKNHKVIVWFWNLVKTFSQEQLGKLLHFCTGSTRIPIYGFKKLESNRGNYAKFLIESVNFVKSNPFPKGHTCFNRLQLPIYSNEQSLKMHVMAIVDNNLDGIYGLD